MTIEELRIKLQRCVECWADEIAHVTADNLLLEYIDDDEVARLHGEAAVSCA